MVCVWKIAKYMKARQYNERGEYVVIEVDCPQPTADDLRYGHQMEIERQKSELQESDYKVIKCAEAMAVGAEMPYDVASLHKERQALRDKINKLEQQL